jgi:hypothetical protein
MVNIPINKHFSHQKQLIIAIAHLSRWVTELPTHIFDILKKFQNAIMGSKINGFGVTDLLFQQSHS